MIYGFYDNFISGFSHNLISVSGKECVTKKTRIRKEGTEKNGCLTQHTNITGENT